MTRSSATPLGRATRRRPRTESPDRPARVSQPASLALVGALWVAVLLSAAGVVYCRYRAQQLFIELDRLSAQRDNLDIRWGQLQLEQSAWSTHAIVESVAGKKLHMTMPAPQDIVIVRP